jgi:hypothetical protein
MFRSQDFRYRNGLHVTAHFRSQAEVLQKGRGKEYAVLAPQTHAQDKTKLCIQDLVVQTVQSHVLKPLQDSSQQSYHKCDNCRGTKIALPVLIPPTEKNKKKQKNVQILFYIRFYNFI